MELIEFLEKINDTLGKSFSFQAFKFVLAFYLLVIVVVIILIIYRLVKEGYYDVLQTGQETPAPKGKMQIRWEETKERLESQNVNEWKIAILESASMLNEILSIIGYEGKSIGEKLENMFPSQLENLEQIKEANKVKNRIVNDEAFLISQQEARDTVETFTQALRFLEVIE